jgi:hypothetical protein
VNCRRRRFGGWKQTLEGGFDVAQILVEEIWIGHVDMGGKRLWIPSELAG